MQERETLLVEATARFEAGEAPTQEAVVLWRRLERSKLMAAEAAANASLVRVVLEGGVCPAVLVVVRCFVVSVGGVGVSRRTSGVLMRCRTCGGS